MNSTFIDIIFITFFAILIVYGYKKGFVTRLYDLVTTCFVLFLAYFLSQPLSSIVILYRYNESDILIATFGRMTNRIMVFVLTFICLYIIKKIIGIFMKPILKKMVDFFSLTEFIDKGLGVCLSVVEAILISYIMIVFVVFPFVDNGISMVEDTVVTKQVLNVGPDLSKNVITIVNGIQAWEDARSSTTEMTKSLLLSKEWGLIDNQQFKKIFEDHIATKLKTEKIVLNASQKEELKKTLTDMGYSNDSISEWLSKIDVSDNK